ncbi:zinc finger BED domain-containing 1-like protein [Labeo rohita]|uniref:E3 SUMO-protein ligase ZBED1 n=3 Tax=Labeo rohita TaxID=84645 RepID=A0ABQ8L2L7_LABRO|nr:E3 SUMO-protein ligase ZBED1 [Labeo rohita]KAI2644978.1 E3 SUMO-protein ligase ZBED1 [Labeo rohita]KAI2661546.1 E3 SUMO-protein ligase ZBED1 [Labeo rohita]RXN15671.1 zinc finger BED domain-containing 1-like protein [Labeo rohita]
MRDEEDPPQKSDFVPKRKSKSSIWDYFGYKKEDVDQNEVLCMECHKVVATKHGNTTNLSDHLKRHHKALYDEYKAKSGCQPKQTNICDAFASVTPYQKGSQRQKEITDAITFHIAKDMLPLNTVAKEGFKKMIRTLDRRYVIPSRTYFSQVAIKELYEKCKSKIEAELSHVEYYATTTDLWSSRTTEPYMSLTVHFITEDFELKSRCLQTAFFPESHTAENIAEALREAVSAWGLDETRQVCITTDNAANMVKAADLNKWTRLQCFGHRLHLAIENAVKKDGRIDRAIGVCKKLVSHFSHSWKASDALAKVQKELSLPSHCLISECQTRWGSRQMMISRILEQQQALTQVLSADKKLRHLIPTWQDIDVLESVSKSLGPMLDFTDALSGDEYVSVSFVKPVLQLFNTSLLEMREEDTDLTKNIKKKMLDYLNEKYEDDDTQKLLDMASFLDPRFKMDFISADKKTQVKATVASQMMECQKKSSCSTDVEPNVTSATQAKKAKKSLGSFFKQRETEAKGDSSLTLKDALEAELNTYLLTPPIDKEEDPLAWWKVHKLSFPHLARLARKYLCIPATSSPSERLFSTSGNIVTCQRTCLKPAKVDRLVFLAKNLE